MKIEKRDRNKEPCLADLVNMKKPEDVMYEVKRVISMELPGFDFGFLNHTFNDINMLFSGKFPGYKECNIFYHDLKHTTDTFLAMARLIHGYLVKGGQLSEKDINLGLISTLMHDTGYIQHSDDNLGTGAKYTLEHVSRSIEFTKQYLKQNDYSEEDIKFGENSIICTDLSSNIKEIDFSSHEEEIISKMLGSADLLGQMADRTYLEKLNFLYAEFKEANVPGFENEFDLVKKTIGFNDIMQKRLEDDLGNQKRYMIHHFKKRWNIDKDMYSEAIERNMGYLKLILDKSGEDYSKHLRRK